MSPNLASPVGKKTLDCVERVHHVERREAARLHLLAVEVGHDRADLAADRPPAPRRPGSP